VTSTLRFIALALVLLTTVSAFSDDTPLADPDKDPQIANLLGDAGHLLASKNPVPAVEMCDKVIDAFKARYGSGQQKIYCARTRAECLAYLLAGSLDKTNEIVRSSNALPGGVGKTNETILSSDGLTGSLGNKKTIVLSSNWAKAYFLKGYALQDLRRLAESKSNLELALELSPFNSQYLSERGSLFQLEKNWPKAKEQFASAEDNAPLSPENTRADELGRARRGLAYVFVELGKLDEAEKKYQQCLAANPNDMRAKRELKYVQGLRAKDKSQ